MATPARQDLKKISIELWSYIVDRVNVVQNWNNGPNGPYRPVQPAHLGRFSILSVSSTLSTLYSVEFYCLKQERSGRDGAKKGNPQTTFMVRMRMVFGGWLFVLFGCSPPQSRSDEVSWGRYFSYALQKCFNITSYLANMHDQWQEFKQLKSLPASVAICCPS